MHMLPIVTCPRTGGRGPGVLAHGSAQWSSRLLGWLGIKGNDELLNGQGVPELDVQPDLKARTASLSGADSQLCRRAMLRDLVTRA